MKRSPLVGLLAAAVALAVGELVAGIRGSRTSPVIAVGDRFIENVPRPVKDFAIETFGTNDKLALLVGIYTVVALLAVVVGVVAVRRFVLGAAGIVAFGLVGAWAGAPLASLLGAAAGIGTLRLLVGATAQATAPPVRPALDRRAFLGLAVGAAALAAGAGSVGRFLQNQASAASSRLAVVLPRPQRSLRPLPPDVHVDVSGVSPFVTPNDDFYRIDVNLVVPQVETAGWTLRIHGMVDEERTLTYEELLDLGLVEEDITLACVSNEVGGDLVGNARWLGVPLLPLLESTGIDARADQVVGRAVDGFTVGFPVEALRDGRPALVAVGMNQEPLPLRHGFPARLIVAGLYGYVSATKWLSEIELTRFDRFDPYWIRRGWAERAPIKTMSRIDTPRGLQRVRPGRVPIAGVAWAPTRGIERVEVRVDDGPWREAELAAVPNELTWRQWHLPWDATPGRHQLTVRATDGTGALQVQERMPPFPDGATGWHSVAVLVGD